MDKEVCEYLISDEKTEDGPYFESNLIIKRCASWTKFKEALCKIAQIHELMKKGDIEDQVYGVPLYRGHADAKWALQTTLERVGHKHNNVHKHYQMLSAIGRQIKTCGVKNVPENIVGYAEIAAKLKEVRPLPSLAFLSFVRHLGFPSPLLDWSRSPYVAAFFSFSRCTENDSVSVYVLLEKRMRSTQSTPDKPGEITELDVIGEYVSTHRRHFMQQSNYTVCVTRDSEGTPLQFSPYGEHLLKYSYEKFPEAIIFKLILPGTEKREALKELDRMNINSYSLFGSDEALMETLFNREAFLKE